MFCDYAYSQHYFNHIKGGSRHDFIRTRYDGPLEICYLQINSNRLYGRWDNAGFDDYANKMDMMKEINERLFSKYKVDII